MKRKWKSFVLNNDRDAKKRRFNHQTYDGSERCENIYEFRRLWEEREKAKCVLKEVNVPFFCKRTFMEDEEGFGCFLAGNFSEHFCELGRLLDEPRERFICVKVKLFNGRVVRLSLSNHCTVGDLKCKLEEGHRVVRSRQRLVFRGKNLCDDAALCSCGIEDGTTLYLTFQMCGGCCFPFLLK